MPFRRLAALAALATALPAQSFVNHESGPVQPIRVASDGSRLFVGRRVRRKPASASPTMASSTR